MYGITENTKETLGNQPIPAGINENVTFKGATFESMKEDKPPVLQYVFEDESGGVLTPVVWPLDPDRIKRNAEDFPKEHKFDDDVRGFKKGKAISPEEAVMIAGDRFNAFNKHILSKFVSDEKIIESQKDVDSYDSFARSVVKLLEEADLSQPVRLIVTYDYKGKYLQLPSFPPFIESMEVPKEKSKLRITQYHNMTPASQTAVQTPEDLDSAESFDDIDDDPSF